ncbi:MAG TPA: polysaccharide deacetylase family protein [Chitinophagaceae bacterium]|nr:polysaccharide deacetylase family protein [Chitinophagaceae bacterium]
MHRYFVKTNWIVRKLFPRYIWRLPKGSRTIYLTFDDGPHPEATPFVLDLLQQYGAKATFFCTGNNAEAYPELIARIRAEGHSIGNHTYDHPNGWDTEEEAYLENVARAAQLLPGRLFRPPYGRIRAGQARRLAEAMGVAQPRIIMWDVLSCDFDTGLTPEQCLCFVNRNYEDGSIVVFHDSAKALPRLRYALSGAIRKMAEEGFRFDRIVEERL